MWFDTFATNPDIDEIKARVAAAESDSAGLSGDDVAQQTETTPANVELRDSENPSSKTLDGKEPTLDSSNDT